jgi:diguanylate cyclase (GGDEF)-like protein/PAS domain S-box-containing protein
MGLLFAHSRAQERRYLVVLAVVVVLLGSVFPLLMQTSYTATAELHATLDIVGSLLGVIAGLALVAHYSSLGDRISLFLGLAFFLSGLADLVSGLLLFAFSQGWTGLTAVFLSRYTITAYVAGRLFMGLITLLAPLALVRMGEEETTRREAAWITFLVMALAAVATALVFMVASPTFLSGAFRGRPVDFLLGLLYVAALAVLLMEYHRERDMLTWWVTLSISVSALSLFIMAFSRAAYDIFHNVGHAYKVIGYVVPIVGFPICQIATAVERRQALAALQEQRSMFRTVLANTPDLIALKNLHFVYEAVNSAFCRFVGRAEEEIVGRTDYDLFDRDQAESYRRGDAEVLSTGQSVVQDEQVVRGGESQWFHILRAPVPDGRGRHIAILSSVRDITELKRMEHKLRLMSHTDELTGLHNRRGFFVLSEQILKKARRNRWHAALIYMDLDNMKAINDMHGHNEGDRVLVDVADVLRRTFRDSDIMARVGGDEFVVLALETSGRGEADLVRRLEGKWAEFTSAAKRPYQVSVSLGVAYYDSEAPVSLDELLSRADGMMYRNKRAKRASP